MMSNNIFYEALYLRFLFSRLRITFFYFLNNELNVLDVFFYDFQFYQKNYDKFDGFVILHGTDTMAYTASALSFMLEDLGKPVILTGAQVMLIFDQRILH